MPDGLNAVRGSVQLAWDPISATDAATIRAFLLAHVGVRFFYTLPRESQPRQWIATRWQRAYPGATTDSFMVTLEERFGSAG